MAGPGLEVVLPPLIGEISKLLPNKVSNMILEYITRYLSTNSRTCTVEVCNKTTVELNNPLFPVKDGYLNDIPESIAPDDTKSVNFFKKDGLFGCSGLLSYKYSEECRIVLAFRVPLVQIRKSARNKFAIATIAATETLDFDLYKDMMHSKKRKEQSATAFASSGTPLKISSRAEDVKLECSMTGSTKAKIKLVVKFSES